MHVVNMLSKYLIYSLIKLPTMSFITCIVASALDSISYLFHHRKENEGALNYKVDTKHLIYCFS